MESTTTKSSRAAQIENPQLGCGNFLATAIALAKDPSEKRIFLEDGFRTRQGESLHAVSLLELQALAEEEAAAYCAAGVVANDPVVVSLDDGFSNLVHFIALTRLGAIPALVNTNLRADLAGGFVGRVGAVGVVASTERLAAMAAHLPPHLRFATAALPAGVAAPPSHIHHGDDPVLLCHSSGTTGVPKAVAFLHHNFFYGIRQRLREDAPPSRLLSALPHSHSAGIAFPMLALLRDEPVMLVRGTDAARILACIEQFRATTVVAFPYTFVEIAESPALWAGRDLSTLRAWVNTGDAAHFRHIEKLVALGGPDGSAFIDGLGSSEMGFSLFRVVYSRSTSHPARCVGRPHPFVEAVVLGENGELLPPGVVGRLGVKSPTLTSGYWNDSVLTARSRCRGYWLTGDLVYQDTAGEFVHVDRTTDVITTAHGPVYSLLTEEILLRGDSDLVDVTVFGVPTAGGTERAVALLRIQRDANTTRDWLTRVNALLNQAGYQPLDEVLIPSSWEDIPVGPTGKVRKTALRQQFAERAR